MRSTINASIIASLMLAFGLAALMVVLPATARAQCGLNSDYKKGRFPSAKKLETPPDDALQINSGVARVLVKQLLERRHPIHIPDRFLIPGADFFESTNVRVSGSVASFDYETADKKSRVTHHAKLEFKELGYAIYGPGENKGPFFCVADYSNEFRKAVNALFLNNVLTWRDEKDARLFSRAFNRLVYDARKGTASDDLTGFDAVIAQLRASGAKPPTDWDKHRILAEQSIKDRDFTGAVQHFEDGVASFPLWAEGWFNAALLYGELGEYEYAANRMRHYLVLMPEAPDSKAAREKVIVWDDKANK